MNFDQTNTNHRVVVALLVSSLATLVVWGAWMIVAAVLGIVGWVADRIGAGLLVAASTMTDVHLAVALVGLGCGAVVGVIIGFNLRADRLWNRLSGRGGESPGVGTQSM